MFVLRNQPKGARFASFGLGLCVFALMPTEIGYQDIASLLARQPGVAERWQKRVFSAVGTTPSTRIGRPSRAPASATSTVAEVHTSPRVCSASAIEDRSFEIGRPYAPRGAPVAVRLTESAFGWARHPLVRGRAVT
jgi:hypothetical protein